MAENQSYQIQKIVLEWFKDITDDLVMDFIYVFNYNDKAMYPETNDLLDKFLSDNGLKHSYTNYLVDLKDADNPDKMFRRQTYSDMSILEDIRNSLFNLCFNRFKNIIFQNRVVNSNHKLEIINKNIEIYDLQVKFYNLQIAALKGDTEKILSFDTVKPKSVKVIKEKTFSNKNFNFIKNELLETYDCLNSNEHYMYSEEEDGKLVEKVKKMKNE